jgi:hypothetical protein
MPRPAHIIVFGNEKGGSGKSTTAMHVVVALLKAGRRVASIDTDGRQRSLTRFVENRAVWARRTGAALELPTHFTVPPGSGDTVSDIEGREFRAFAEAISRTEHRYDFVVIDTPGSNSYLMRVSHAMADTLVTPINESFIDFDVLATVDPSSLEVWVPATTPAWWPTRGGSAGWSTTGRRTGSSFATVWRRSTAAIAGALARGSSRSPRCSASAWCRGYPSGSSIVSSFPAG